MGAHARAERFVANMVYRIAAGQRIDPDATPMFGEQLDEVYANPFERLKKKKKQPQTFAEIREYVIGLLEGTHGSDDNSREAGAG